jgi:hypothetical protein
MDNYSLTKNDDYRCWTCDQPFSDEEWEDRHTPDDNPLGDCHADCCEFCLGEAEDARIDK